MTKDEAIKMLISKMDGNTDTSYEWAETVRMAIKALEQQPSDDCIARQPLIDNWNSCADMLMNEGDSAIVMDWIFDAPPVTPAHGACEKCLHIDLATNVCEKIELAVPNNFYCKDFKKRGK